ncbi:hypothetical protein HK101_005383 [Irineochytrium annulatum]|nr:hypothetical protein HK101_005383 [Irineochytrium annulatum]
MPQRPRWQFWRKRNDQTQQAAASISPDDGNDWLFSGGRSSSRQHWRGGRDPEATPSPMQTLEDSLRMALERPGTPTPLALEDAFGGGSTSVGPIMAARFGALRDDECSSVETDVTESISDDDEEGGEGGRYRHHNATLTFEPEVDVDGGSGAGGLPYQIHLLSEAQLTALIAICHAPCAFRTDPERTSTAKVA